MFADNARTLESGHKGEFFKQDLKCRYTIMVTMFSGACKKSVIQLLRKKSDIKDLMESLGIKYNVNLSMCYLQQGNNGSVVYGTVLINLEVDTSAVRNPSTTR